MTLETPSQEIYLISQANKRLLGILDNLSAKGRIVNALITGPQGSGKSKLAAQYASSRRRPFAVFEVGLLSESAQIFGAMHLFDGHTVYVPGLFTKAISTPNCVVHLQELNRPESDKALNALFSILDDSVRGLWIDEAQSWVKVAPGVTIFASMNEGYEFIGTMPLDSALRDRFHMKLQLDYLPSAVVANLMAMTLGLPQSAATEICSLSDRLRQNTQAPISISTRQLIQIAEFVQAGLPILEAMKSVVGGDSDQLESILLTEHIQGRDFEQAEQTYEVL